MKKIHIIILTAAIIVCFAGTFGATWYYSKTHQPLPEVTETEKPTDYSSTDKFEVNFVSEGEDDLVRSMTEKQLQSLIYDIREKLKQYHQREQQLKQREERLELAEKALEQDIEEFNNLRVELTSTLTSLRQQEQSLEDSIVQVDELRRTRMKQIAERYDKMDTVQAAQIMVNMVQNRQLEDVVMILFYMTERPGAKLLGEIGGKDPQIACLLNDKLSKVKEME